MNTARAPGRTSAALPIAPRRLREDLPVYAISTALLAICLAALAAKGLFFGFGGIYQNARFYLLTTAVLLVLGAVWRMWRDKPARPTRHLFEYYYLDRTQRERLLGALPGLAILICFMPTFSALKSTIPLFHAYNWDRSFINFERALLLGHDAWELLQPVLGYPLVTSVLSVLYHAWILLCYPGTVYFLVGPADNRLRRRFLLGFVLAWSLIGGVLATLLASYGPVFAGPLAGISDFDAQMAYLRAANEHWPVMTLTVQDMLLARFHADSHGLGSGISAMPSMHVAMSYLFYLAIRELHPRLGWAFLAFCATIWIASVHLAYHYALDGVLSVLAVALIWKATGWLFTWWDARLPA